MAMVGVTMVEQSVDEAIAKVRSEALAYLTEEREVDLRDLVAYLTQETDERYVSRAVAQLLTQGVIVMTAERQLLLAASST
jgi:hypothetical protein